MSKRISIANLATEITLAVAQYTEDVSEAIEQELEETAKLVLADVKANSPTDTDAYKKGWRIRRQTYSGGKVRYTVHQKTKPQIAHLLEFGHAKVNGGRVNAKPTNAGHIRPAYNKHVPAMHERIKRIIEEGGK